MRRRRAVAAGATLAAGLAGGFALGTAGGGAVAASSGSSTPTTAAVIRTDLASTVQVGGSIGFSGSGTVVAPTGITPAQIAQDQQAVTQADESVKADQTGLADDRASGDQQASAAQAAVATDQSTLSSDEAARTAACAGPAAATPGCAQAEQKVTEDQSQVTQAEQQLASAEASATKSVDQDQAKLTADVSQAAAAGSTLALAEQTALVPGNSYTSLPSVGQVITRGEAIYSIDGAPVPLLYGAVPAYRALRLGSGDGPDVAELTANLIALGFGAGLTPSTHFTAATENAVERWQRALNLPVTGALLLGSVAFEPGPIRVTSVTPSVGQAVAPGAVLDTTTTDRVVSVDLSVTQEYLVHRGQAVSVVLPDGTTTVGGHVEAVSDVATCPGGGGTGAGNGSPNSGSGSPESSTCPSSGGGSSSPTVAVTTTLDDPAASGTLDEAPVNVDITTQRANGVLAVPISALLALEEGGYGVEVVSGGTTRLVGVTTGLFSNTLVEISGRGIAAGTVVEVPSA